MAAIYWPDAYKGYMIGSASGGQLHNTLYARHIDGSAQAIPLGSTIGVSGQGVGLERMKFRCEAVDVTGEQIIRETFLWAVRGRAFPFYIFDHPEGRAYGQLNILGIYGATPGELLIPAKDLTSLTNVKEDGVAVTAGYSYTNAIGPGGETRINFAAPLPNNGAYITADWVGRKRYRMELLSDFTQRDPFAGGATEPQLFTFEMDMQERPGPDLA